MSANNDKRIKTPNGVTTYAYGYGSQRKSLKYTKKELSTMINLDEVTEGSTKEHNPHWPHTRY